MALPTPTTVLHAKSLFSPQLSVVPSSLLDTSGITKYMHLWRKKYHGTLPVYSPLMQFCTSLRDRYTFHLTILVPQLHYCLDSKFSTFNSAKTQCVDFLIFVKELLSVFRRFYFFLNKIQKLFRYAAKRTYNAENMISIVWSILS